MIIKDTTFPRAEKLKSNKVTSGLFKNGKSVFVYPFKVLFFLNDLAGHGMEEDEGPAPTGQANAKVLISVPKRNIRKAAHRNKVRRRIFEAYRFNKYMLETFPKERKPSYIAIIYVSKESLSFQEIEKKLKGAIKKIRMN